MAAGLGFKTFTTGEVLTAADTNGYLMQGVLVFADAAARDAAITSPAEGQFAYTKDDNGLWYYDGAAWVASGASGGGKVLQVVSTTYSTPVNIATTTITDTGLSLSITPTLDTSKILVLITQTLQLTRTNNEQGAGMILYRGATGIYDINSSGYGTFSYYLAGVTNSQAETIVGISYLDSPATTSATTYKMTARALMTTNSGSITTQNGSKPSSIILMEIGA